MIQREITIEKKGKKKNDIPLSGQYIIGFDTNSEAQSFANKINNSDDILATDYKKYGGKEMAVSDNSGKARISIMPNGRIVWVSTLTGKAIVQEANADGECVFVNEIVVDNNESETNLDKLKDVLGESQNTKPDAITSEVIGKDIFRASSPFIIKPEFARNNYRFGLTPIFICVEHPTDTLCTYRPFTKQGKEYHETQSRRLGFNMLLRDSLAHPNSMDTVYLKDNKQDTLWFHWHARKKDINLHYRVLGDFWSEDYNGVIHRDTIQLDHGKNKNKLRFLDFSLDSMKIGIDPQRYHIDGKMEKRDINLKLKFDFVWSKSYLQEDSRQNDDACRRLVTEFGGAYHDRDITLDYKSVVATGVASPDGRVAGNRKLANDRARAIVSLLKENIPDLAFTPICRDSIAPWRAVADTLLALGDTIRANELYSICNKYKDNIEKQWDAVKISPILDYKNYLQKEIMPRFCIVTFSYSYIVRKTLEYQEIVEKYEHDEAFRNMANKEHYQYEALFHYLRDRLPELEIQAKMAYDNLKETDFENEYNRPWPLAAYVYANCLLKRGHTDLADEPYEGILWPFLRYGIPPLNQDTVRFMREHAFGQYWNDEAIVSTMVGMYFQSFEFLKAQWVAKNYLNQRIRKYDSFMAFLNAYGHESDPLVIEAVAATSAFNAAVIYAAQDEKTNRIKAEPYLKRALAILEDTIFKDNHRAHYLLANLKFRLFGPKDDEDVSVDPFFLKNDTTGKTPEEIAEDLKYDYLEFRLDSVAEIKNGLPTMTFSTWKKRKEYGTDMITACTMHPEYLEEIKWDGYFSDKYRNALFFIFRKKQEGLTNEQIKRAWEKEREKLIN